MEIVNECPVCGSKEFEPKIETQPIKVMECSKCQLKFSEFQMNEEAISSYYENDFSSERHRKGQIINSIMNMSLIRREKIILDAQSILDVGCGYGYLIGKLAEEAGTSSNLLGVELSSVERQYASKRLNESVCFVESLDKITDESCDLIICTEVIEHIKDPVGFLNLLYRKLSNSGLLFLLTDNFGSRVAQKMGKTFPKWIPHSHIVHFDPQSFQKLFSISNFNCIPTVKFFTPAEIYGLEIIFLIKAFLGITDEINFDDYGKTEFKRNLNFFWPRLILNFLVAALIGPSKNDGSLMFSVVKKNNG